MADDKIQHGIDDNPEGDAGKGATLGGVGGAAVGAAAGSMAGPPGMAVGAVVGGLAGAAGSGAAVAAVDTVDNDNTVTGLGKGVTPDVDDEAADLAVDTRDTTYAAGDRVGNAIDNAGDRLSGNDVPGVQTGGQAVDGTQDTRGIIEKIADAITGDKIDDKTGKRVG